MLIKKLLLLTLKAETAVYVFSNNKADALLQATETDIFSKIQAKGFVKTIGMHTKDPDVVAPEAAWVGRFASAIIGSNTWIHKSLTSLVPEHLLVLRCLFLNLRMLTSIRK